MGAQQQPGTPQPPARTVGPQCQDIAGLAWKWGLWVGGRSPSGQVSQCLSPLDGPRHPTQTSHRVHWIRVRCQGLSWACWVSSPLIWAPGCWGAVQDAGHLPGQDQPSALNAALYSVPWLLEEGLEMLGGGQGPLQGAPARLVCVLGEWDVRLLSVSLLQGTSVLSVPPVPAMSGAWGWVWWVPAPLGVPCPQDPTLGAGGAWHSCVAAVLSGCLAVSLSARSDLSFSLFPPLPHCSRSSHTSSPSSLLHLFPPPFFSISSLLSPLSSPSSFISFLLSLCTLCRVSVSFSLLPTSSWWERD